MKTYLYNNGTQTVAWEKNNNVYADESSYYSGAPAVITLNDDSVSVEAVLSSSGRGAKWVTSQPVDITYVSKICVNVQSVSSNSHAKGVAISRTKDGYCQGTGTLGNKTYNSTGIQEFDVSNITGEVYVSLFCMCNQTGGNSSQTVTEVYLASEYEINTTIDPVGSGSVTENWTSLRDVSLTAVPSSGYKFNRWESGGTTYTDNPLTITVNSDMDFIVYFDRSNCFIKVNGEWKQGILYRKDTTWKEAEVFVKNGTWKGAI